MANIKIYTKTGDKGKTSLFGGKRVSKADLRVDTYGTVDELNSVLGAVIAQLPAKTKSIQENLTKIQYDLLAIGANLANPLSGEIKGLENRVTEFEKQIDQMTEKLPELRNFILPGGGSAGSLLHMARTIARRAERRMVALSEQETVHTNVKQYFNRLSDLLFTMARFINHVEKKPETIWSSSSA